MGKRGRRAKTVAPNKVTVCSFSESSLEPLAASSPERVTPNNMADDEFDQYMRQRVDTYMEESRKGFQQLVKTFDPSILAMPFSHFVAAILDEGEGDKETHTSNKQQEHNISEFKLPLSVPKTRKKGDWSCASTSKGVHWDSALDPVNGSVEKDQSDSDVFKTPPKKGGNVKEKKSTVLKTPNTSRKEQFAVVTPGPMMSKSLRVLRMPQAGETAVSLSGSPLLVTPFGATTSGVQTALTLATDNGRVMTIVKPDQTSPTTDPDMFSQLEDNTKQQITEFAKYLLKNMGDLQNNQTQ